MAEKLIENVVYLQLKTDFSTEEKAQFADEMGKTNKKILALDEEFEVQKTKYKEKSTSLEKTMNSFLSKATQGWEDRKVKCIEYSDKDGKRIKLIRQDSGVEVKGNQQPIMHLPTSEPLKEIIDDKPGRIYKKLTGNDDKDPKCWEKIAFSKLDRGDTIRVVNPDGSEFIDGAGNNVFNISDRSKKADKGMFRAPVIAKKVVFKKK